MGIRNFSTYEPNKGSGYWSKKRKVDLILEWIRNNPGMQQFQIAHGIGLERGRQVASSLENLKLQGKIKQQGGGYYVE